MTTKVVKAGPKETATQDEPPVGANVEEASVPEVQGEQEADAQAEKPKQTMVRLKDAQHFEIRTIRKADFAGIGIDAPEDIHWSPVNGFMQPKKRLLDFMTEGQYENVILADSRFEEVEA